MTEMIELVIAIIAVALISFFAFKAGRLYEIKRARTSQLATGGEDKQHDQITAVANEKLTTVISGPSSDEINVHASSSRLALNPTEHFNTVTIAIDTPDDWFLFIRAIPWKDRFELSWVEIFGNLAPQTTAFWASTAKALIDDDRLSDSYDAWQRAIKLEKIDDKVDRLDMAESYFNHVEKQGDYDHYFTDKALDLFSELGAWQMVAYIYYKRELAKPMLEALAKAYQFGGDWAQPYLDAPYGIKNWDELEFACRGDHEGMWHHFRNVYWDGIKLPEFSIHDNSENKQD